MILINVQTIAIQFDIIMMNSVHPFLADMFRTDEKF